MSTKASTTEGSQSVDLPKRLRDKLKEYNRHKPGFEGDSGTLQKGRKLVCTIMDYPARSLCEGWFHYPPESDGAQLKKFQVSKRTVNDVVDALIDQLDEIISNCLGSGSEPEWESKEEEARRLMPPPPPPGPQPPKSRRKASKLVMPSSLFQ